MPFILLSSAVGDQASTRSFREFSSRDELAQAIISYFEDYLVVVQKSSDSETDALEYASEDLLDFIDKFFGELVCLEQQDEDLWIPYSTHWVKESIYLYLRTVCKDELNDDQIMEIAID